MPVRLLLRVEGDAAIKRVFEFAAPARPVFGRDPRADCRIQDEPLLSRRHFMLEIDPPRAVLRDLGSTNGVLVGDTLYGGKAGLRDPEGKPPPAELRPGAQIRIGKTVLTFEVAAAPQEEIDQFCDSCGALVEPAGDPAGDGRVLCLSCRVLEEKEAALLPAAAPPAGGTENGAAPSPVAAALPDINMERLEIPGYRITRLIGTGRHGPVYHAVRLDGHQDVAVKVLPRGLKAPPARLEQFRRELSIIQMLRHENVAACLGDGVAEGCPYAVLEYVGGGNLARHVEKRGNIAPAEALPLMRQMTLGLAAAHRMGLSHLDIRPSNVLLTGVGSDLRAKLSDLGLAKAMTASGLAGPAGTPRGYGDIAYMPPEQLSAFAQMTPACDVFSLGATFYHMLAGRPPYNAGNPDELAQAVLTYDLTPLAKRAPRLPRPLAELIDRCLAADCLRRFADAGQLLAAINKLPMLA